MTTADIGQIIQHAAPAGITMLVLGLGFAIVLLIASIKLAVKMDPRVEQVLEVLPHVDCGACGYPGCAGYAKGVIENPGELIGKCSPGGTTVAEKIGRVLNLQISGGGAPLRPMVHCRGRLSDKTFYAPYTGIPKCTAANAYANAMACKFGCLGLGDCTRACKCDALHIVEGLATVDYQKCTGCGACAKACPRGLIQMVPFRYENMMVVACSSKESGKVTRTMCRVGCIGCGICARQSELFVVKDNLAKIDFAKYEPSEKTETAMTKCPTGVILYRGATAPAPREPKEAAAKA